MSQTERHAVYLGIKLRLHSSALLLTMLLLLLQSELPVLMDFWAVRSFHSIARLPFGSPPPPSCQCAKLVLHPVACHNQCIWADLHTFVLYLFYLGGPCSSEGLVPVMKVVAWFTCMVQRPC